MIERAICESVFHEAVIACDPAARVRGALDREPLPHGRNVIGLAIGKAALAMARGAGPVMRGLVVAPMASARRYAWTELAPGWLVAAGGHPIPDETSLAAGAWALHVIDTVGPDDVVLALISGGASALVEQPRDGISIAEFRERVQATMASGAPIDEINRLRTELSALKGGKLAARCKAPIITLVVSDVIGDDPRVIGSGPTVTDPQRDTDRVEVVAPMARFGIAVEEALGWRRGAARHESGLADVLEPEPRAPTSDVRRIAEPLTGDVAAVADRLAAEAGVIVAWGEPTVRVPADHGRGGRAQQLALELAKRLRGMSRSAFVAGSDGIDGPDPRAAAGAYVDGTTWDAIVAAKLDPDAALRRCDAGTALAAVGALFVPGPTGINHADIVIVG
jgi:hydroxypyruvate reductase